MHKLLLTSPAGYAQRLTTAFKEEDADQFFVPESIPMIRTTIATDDAAFVSFLHELATYDYIAFSSRKAIEAFAVGLQQEGIPLPATVRLCAIGKDNEMLREALHVEPAFIAAEPSPMGIVRHLESLSLTGAPRIAVLAPQVIGMEEPSIVPDFIRGLAQIGMRPIRINAYHTQAAAREVLADTASKIMNNAYESVIFTSGTEIKVFLQMIPENVSLSAFFQHLTVICYGPYTARCASEYGVKVDFTSPSFGSFQELVKQVKIYYKDKK